MERTAYKPKVVEGRIKGTGWPIDGHTLMLSLWDYDDHESWHLSIWNDKADQAVMETVFITETAAGSCLYDTLKEFAEHWDEWEPEGSFRIPLENVEVVKVIQAETKEVESLSEVDTSGLKQPIICVYRNPKDFPDKCVARIFDGTKPTNIVITRDTVDEIRLDIARSFPDKLPFARWREDHKSVVESWI